MKKCAWVVVGLLFSCGGSQTQIEPLAIAPTETTPPPPAPAPEALMPADTIGLVRIDIEDIRTSPYYSKMREWLGLVPEINEERSAGIDELIAGVDFVQFSFVPGSSSPLVGAIYFEGTLSLEKLETIMHQMMDEHLREQLQRGEFEGYQALISQHDSVIVHLEEGKWLMGPFDKIRAVLQTPSIPSAIQRARTKEETLVGSDAAVVGWILKNEDPNRNFDALDFAAGELRADDGIQTKARFQFDTPEHAQEAHREYTDRNQPFFALPIVSTLADHVQFRIEGSDVWMDFALDDAETRELMSQFEILARTLLE